MSHFEIFGLYLIANLVLMMVLTVAIIRFRMNNAVSLGDGGSPVLHGRVRAHGNFVENAPLHLLALISMTQLGTSSLMLHVVGGTFIVGRVLHAWGITRERNANLPRQIGVVLTLVSFAVAIAYIAFLVLQSRGSYGIS